MSQELTRNKLQEKAMQILYSHLLLEQLGKSKDIVTLIEESCDLPFDEVDVFLKLSLVKAIKYKDELIEYVTYHELCHFKYLNHQPAFHAYLQKYCPNERKLKQCLKNYRTDYE